MRTYRQPFTGEYPITQGYGETITDPKGHTGIDYGCPYGTPILASSDGIVMFAGWDNTGYGNCVIIMHTADCATLYAHLSSISVWNNQKVHQGDVIGYSGSTGNSTGAHLHFEARTKWNDYDSNFDPMLLPLMTVDDSLHTEQKIEPLTEGVCEVCCSAAFVRDWSTVTRQYMVYEGEKLYIFPDVKMQNGLPFYFIGANRCIAQYDVDGTQIIRKVE